MSPGIGVRYFKIQEMAYDMPVVLEPFAPKITRPKYDQHLDLIRGVLDEAAYTAAWQAGSAMTPEQAIANALEEDS